MKKAILGFLSILLVFASLWGANNLSQKARSRQKTDATMWV
jgi:CHASE3 domain sensor protein